MRGQKDGVDKKVAELEKRKAVMVENMDENEDIVFKKAREFLEIVQSRTSISEGQKSTRAETQAKLSKEKWFSLEARIGEYYICHDIIKGITNGFLCRIL